MGQPTPVFAVITVAVAAFRFVALTRSGAPVGVDAGNWLAFGHALGGTHVRDAGLIYPPLVPILTVAATTVLGLTAGVAALAAGSSVLAGISTFLVLRWSGFRWAAVALAALGLGASAIGEPTAWGGYPQLIGLGALPLLLWWMDETMDRWRWSRALGGSTALLVIMLSSHLVAIIAVVTGAILVLCRTLDRHRNHRLAAMGRVAVVVAPAVLLVPLYLPLVRLMGSSINAPGDLTTPASGLLWEIGYMGREATWFWIPAIIIATVTPLVLIPRWRERLWVINTAIVLGTWALALKTGQGRILYALPLSVVLSGALWWTEIRRLPALRPPARYRVLVAAAAALLAGVTISGLRFFDAQVNYYSVLSPDAVGAIEWLRDQTPPGSPVLVNSVNSAPVGWWVEGLGERPAWYASPLEWLNFSDERRRAEVANDLLADGFPSPDRLEAARRHGIDYVLLIRTRPDDRTEFRVPGGMPLAYWSPTAVIVPTGRTG